MSLKHMIAKKTQCNYRLNRKIIHLKRCWDEVSLLLDTAYNRRHRPPPPPPPKPHKPTPCEILMGCPPPPKPPRKPPGPGRH